MTVSKGRYIGIAVGSFLFLLLCPIDNRMSWNLRILFFWLVRLVPNMIKLFLMNIDWLYWCLLFVPFYAFYICIGEKLFMLKSHVNILQQDVSGKTKFIEWQNMAMSQLDLRLVDLSKEVETLRRSNENFRREEETWRRCKELMRKKIREQQSFMTREAPIVREKVFNTVRQEIVTLVKKNKSEYNLRNKKLVEGETTSSSCTTPKSSRSSLKSLPSITMDTKKCSSQEWERARMRLNERSKRIMMNRNIAVNGRADEQYDKSMGSKSASSMEVQNTMCLEPVVHTSRSSDPLNKSFTGPGVPGYEMREFGDPKVKSYTEVFKRKVHVPTGGNGPRITIEGQRRWCF